jgi:hypothetical protein
MFGLPRHQPTNGRGLARAETTGNDVRDRHLLFMFKAVIPALDACVPACARPRTWQRAAGHGNARANGGRPRHFE